MIALALGELFVRSICPQVTYRYPVGLYVNQPRRGYGLAPGFTGEFKTSEFRTKVRINRQGVRAPTEFSVKDIGTERILFIGDSFTMSYTVGLPDSWPKILERELNDAGEGYTLETINAGVPGYSTHQALDFLRADLLLFEPDLVVLGFFVGNDIQQNAFRKSSIRVEQGYLVSSVAPEGILNSKLRHWLARNLHLYHLLWPFQRALLNPKKASIAARGRLEERSIYSDKPAERIRRGWIETEAALGEFVDVLRTRAARGLVVLIPDPIQMTEPFSPQGAAALAESSTGFAREYPNTRIRRICERLGLPVVDLLPAFLSYRDRSALYHPVDGHWTRVGNYLAGRHVASSILEAELLGDSRTVRGDAQGIAGRRNGTLD